ncbi:MAG: 4-hydroxybutyrate CoA-transferase [Peptococcaceae bacterium]|nr:4-hydroxybutyrate CoA-transferase [Peptococcaceae bacterium]
MQKWQAEYQKKLVNPGEAVKLIESGQTIVLPLGAGEPSVLLAALVRRKDELEGVTLHQMLPIRSHAYLQPGMEKSIRHNSWFTSGVSRGMVQQGIADVTPNYFFDAPRLMAEYLDVDVLMATVSPMDEHGFFSFGLSIDYTSSVAQRAKAVILEVNPNMPRTLGDSFIHISQVTLIAESDISLPELKPLPISDTELAIGRYIADLIEDGSTVQLGIGGIPNAVAHCLHDKADLGIHSEMLTDGMVDLVEKGVVTGRRKSMHPRKIIGSFAFGSERLYRFLDNNPMVEMHPVSYTNDPLIIGQQYKAVSVNAAMEVDLIGQCASESIGPIQFSGTGGQADFARGVLRSEGGKGFIAIASTAKKGTVSKIVPMAQQGAIVTTSKNDVDHVVTEYGVAKLRGKTIRQRAEAMIAIAHPDFRDQLREAAHKLNFV